MPTRAEVDAWAYRYYDLKDRTAIDPRGPVPSGMPELHASYMFDTGMHNRTGVNAWGVYRYYTPQDRTAIDPQGPVSLEIPRHPASYQFDLGLSAYLPRRRDFSATARMVYEGVTAFLYDPIQDMVFYILVSALISLSLIAIFLPLYGSAD